MVMDDGWLIGESGWRYGFGLDIQQR